MMKNAEKVICAVLHEESIPWNAGLAHSEVDLVLDAGRIHGVLPLLASKLHDEDFKDQSDNILTACRETARQQAVYELAHRAELIRVLDALHAAGIQPIILKGTALAYNLYSNPALRPRGDTDLLIRPEWRNETYVSLERMGYAKNTGGEGALIFYQATWSRKDSLGLSHNLDIHWRTNNSEVLAKSLNFDELSGRSTELTALGPHARTPDPIHTLLFACIHRAGHAHSPMYFQGVAFESMNRLIWLYDIHLLVSTMSVEELDEFTALAAAKQIKEICHNALLRTQERFATNISQSVMDSLINNGPIEPSAVFLSGSGLRLKVENFRAFESWRARVGWTWQLAFPPAHYMRWKYPNATQTPLPLLYIRRAFSGLLRLIRQGKGDT